MDIQHELLAIHDIMTLFRAESVRMDIQHELDTIHIIIIYHRLIMGG